MSPQAHVLNMAPSYWLYLGGYGTCRKWDPVGENGSVGTSCPWVHLVLQSPSCPPQGKKVSGTGSKLMGPNNHLLNPLKP